MKSPSIRRAARTMPANPLVCRFAAVALVSLVWLGSPSPVAGQVQDPATGCPESDVVSYSAPTPEAMNDISISQVSPSVMTAATRGLTAERSLHGTAAFFLSKPDTTRPGPWTTTVYVR